MDFYSPSDTENLLDKFVSIKNQQSHLESLDEEYLRSEISFIDNKYSWKELFKYTFKNKKTIIPFLDKCIDFTKKFNSLLSKRKKNKDLDNEVDKLIQGGTSLIGEFSPLQFKFANEKTIQQYKKFLSSMKNDIDPFIKFLSNDIKKNKKFLYRNNKTFSRQSIIKMLISKTMKTAEEDKKNEKILSEHAVSYVTFADFLCEVNSRLFLIPLPLTLLKKSSELSSFLIVFLKYIPFLVTLDRNSELFTIFWAPKAAATPKECPWYVLDGKRIEPNLSFILLK